MRRPTARSRLTGTGTHVSRRAGTSVRPRRGRRGRDLEPHVVAERGAKVVVVHEHVHQRIGPHAQAAASGTIHRVRIRRGWRVPPIRRTWAPADGGASGRGGGGRAHAPGVDQPKVDPRPCHHDDDGVVEPMQKDQVALCDRIAPAQRLARGRRWQTALVPGAGVGTARTFFSTMMTVSKSS